LSSTAAQRRPKKSGEAWYDKAFRRDYLTRYRHRSDEAATNETAFIVWQLGLKRRSTILDLCCGAGRHSRALAKAGLKIVALDRSTDLLQAAKDATPSAQSINYIRGDMRFLPLQSMSIDGIVNLFTSFGYFPTDEENLKALREASRVMKTGAPLVMDFLNIHATRKNLVPRSEKVLGNIKLVERRWYDPRTRRLNKVTRITEGRKTSERLESVRAFTSAELTRMFKRCGLRITGQFGDLTGAPYEKSISPRCVLIGKKMNVPRHKQKAAATRVRKT
jgi:ubiquinone/menaquinone biosynthesis C-methylase UbiE